MLTGARVLIYALLAGITMVVLVMTIRKSTKSKLDSYMILICSMLLCWQVIEVALNFSPDTFIAKFFFDVKLPFVSVVTVAWFLYIIRFYGLDDFFPKPVVACLFVIPLFTLFIGATSPWHPYIRETFEVFQTWPVFEYVQVRGPWFWVHSIFCYILAIVAISLAIRQHLKLPKSQRLPSIILLVGLVVIFSGNFAVIVSDIDIDLSLVAATILAILLYQATLNHHGLDFMQRTRNESFNQIDRAMFILDDKEEIVSMNRPARTWLQNEGFTDGGGLFPKIRKQMQDKALLENILLEEESGVDYWFESGNIFNLKQKPILDNSGEIIGRYAVISNETNNRILIDDLDKHSGIDALTGLSNRRQLDLDIERYNKEDGVPFSIIFGDLNNLKETNDKFGHQQGDVLLRVVAEVLKRTCPPSARISRIGGDEYVVLLPNLPKEQTESLVREIRLSLVHEDEQYPFKVSLAMGYATKEVPGQDLYKLLEKADSLMYDDKHAYKRTLAL